ncbi:MAG TPA: CoA ester lyase [Gammaproteobacteria bacterium]|nr:CoA ester lyase [Gammaproteobacteria bacterium]
MESSACDERNSRPGAHEPPLRSLLFVPGDDERKLARAVDAGADALILDLEDSVAPRRKASARALVAEFLETHASHVGGPSLWVRVNAASTPHVDEDLTAVLPSAPRGLVVPKVDAPQELARLGERLDELERDSGLPAGATKLLPIATETPAGVFAMGGYASVGPRLAGLTWGAEDLSAALGAATAVDADGEWLFTYELVRSLCLLAAGAAGVAAIDTVFSDFRDADGLRRQAARARRDGFTGKLAIHPAQIEIINETFRPTREEVDAARRVVAALGDEVGVTSIDGRMLDRPHLLRALRLLEREERLGERRSSVLREWPGTEARGVEGEESPGVESEESPGVSGASP